MRRVAETLLGAPKDVNSADSNGWTPLMIAANQKCLADVEALLAVGADVNKGDEEGFGPLMCGAVRGRTDIVVSLIRRGAVVDATDEYGHTALSWTVTKGDFDVTAKALIEAGADVNKADGGQFTPLMRAALMDHPRCFALLLKHGADVTPINPHWKKTALEMALERGSEKLREIARTIR